MKPQPRYHARAPAPAARINVKFVRLVKEFTVSPNVDT